MSLVREFRTIHGRRGRVVEVSAQRASSWLEQESTWRSTLTRASHPQLTRCRTAAASRHRFRCKPVRHPGSGDGRERIGATGWLRGNTTLGGRSGRTLTLHLPPERIVSLAVRGSDSVEGRHSEKNNDDEHDHDVHGKEGTLALHTVLVVRPFEGDRLVRVQIHREAVA
eukprot:36687-Prymnesium_polylepis.2